MKKKDLINKTVIIDQKSYTSATSRFTRPTTTGKYVKNSEESVESQLSNLSTLTGVEAEETIEIQICQQLLIAGFIQSYVDFYHLTNRADPHSTEAVKITKLRTSIQDMTFIRDNLMAAETARRQGNTQGVYNAYNKLADLYASLLDWRTSVFFHEKKLEVAQLTGDDRAMMSANHSMGIIYQKMGQLETARIFHEKHENIAATYDVLEEIATANVELFKVYSKLATQLELDESFDDALVMYQMCLESAKKSWDRVAEGSTNGKIGSILLQRGDALNSVSYLRQQSQIAADTSDAESRCRACSSLALAYDMLNQADKALDELKLVHTISEQAGDAALQAQACKALGTLYSKVGKLDNAVESLQKYFNLLKGLLNNKSAMKQNPTIKSSAVINITPKDLDIARLYLGISKGNQMMNSYVVALQIDFSALLDWKLNRSIISINVDSNSNIPVTDDNYTAAHAKAEDETKLMDITSNESQVMTDSFEGESKVIIDSSEGESKVVIDSSEGESKVVIDSSEGESKVTIDSSEGESKVVIDSSEGESKVTIDSSEGESK